MSRNDDKTRINPDSKDDDATVVRGDDATRIREHGPDDDADKTAVGGEQTAVDPDKTRAADNETDADPDKTKVAVSDPDQTAVDNDKTQAAPDKTAVSSDKTEVSERDLTDAPPVTGTNLEPGYMLKERFYLDKKLGQGGMGAVFLATDQRRVETRHQDPSVAIKVITGDFARDSRAFIALQRETDKSQTLAHPNIITVYDFDRDRDIFFMTMEALRGQPLDDYIKAGDHPREEVLGYIGDMASAIAYAHKRNIVHSDLKPPNIFITQENTLKILDFGIARAYSEIEGDSAKTDPDEIAGLTPTYAAFEMFEQKPPHPADDVFALGLIAYEMLTGEHPFERKSAPAAWAKGMKPKRIKGIKSFQWQAINKALAFKREDRLQDAEQFRRLFIGVGRRVKQLSAALVVAIASFSAYVVFYQPETGPDIPFEQLEPATQEKVIANLTNGRQALQFGDINGALFYLDKAYQLHPRNPQVMEALGQTVDDVLAAYDPNAPPAQQREYLAQLRELRKYESLSQNATLLEKQKQLEQRLE